MALNKDKKYIVYMHTSPSNKRYIGITCQKPEHRYGKNGNAYTRPTKKGLITYFGKAILKYGWENFKHEILFEGLTLEEANNKEKELIAKYDLMNVEKGYNQAVGGNCHSIGEEGRKNLSEAHKGQKSWNKGIPMTEEAKRKASISHKLHPSRPHRNGLSEEHKAKLKEAWIRRKEKGLGGWSDKQREKFIETIRKSPYKHSEEIRKVISDKNKGRKMSEETKRKLSLKLKGRKLGEEHGKKVREGMRKAKERKTQGEINV